MVYRKRSSQPPWSHLLLSFDPVHSLLIAKCLGQFTQLWASEPLPNLEQELGETYVIMTLFNKCIFLGSSFKGSECIAWMLWEWRKVLFRSFPFFLDDGRQCSE